MGLIDDVTPSRANDDSNTAGKLISTSIKSFGCTTWKFGHFACLEAIDSNSRASGNGDTRSILHCKDHHHSMDELLSRVTNINSECDPHIFCFVTLLGSHSNDAAIDNWFWPDGLSRLD